MDGHSDPSNRNGADAVRDVTVAVAEAMRDRFEEVLESFPACGFDTQKDDIAEQLARQGTLVDETLRADESHVRHAAQHSLLPWYVNRM